MTEVTITQADRDLFISISGLNPECKTAKAINEGHSFTAEIDEIARHRIAERDAIVAWLREKHEAVMSFKDYAPRNIDECAAAIEAGEHHK